MRRFLKESWAREKETEMNPIFLPVFDDLSATARERGTLGETNPAIKPSVVEMSSGFTEVKDFKWDMSYVVFTPNLKPCILSSDEVRILEVFYRKIYNTIEFTLCTSVLKGKDLYLNGAVLGSRNSRTVRSSYVLAFWCDDDGEIDFDNFDLNPHPGQILNFMKHCIVVEGKIMYHYLAKVQWFKKLTDDIRYYYGKPLEVWSSDLFVQEGPATYIPVHRIKSRFVYVKTQKFNKTVIIVSPRERQIL